MKRCCRCGEAKKPGKFRLMQDGKRFSWCIPCEREYGREYRACSKEKQRIQEVRRWRRKITISARLAITDPDRVERRVELYRMGGLRGVHEVKSRCRALRAMKRAACGRDIPAALLDAVLPMRGKEQT
jgi:hypothetical protein